MFWNVLLIAAGAGGAYLIKRDLDRASLHERLQARLELAAQLLGVRAPPLLATTSVNGAASDGQQVLYNPAFFEALESRLCNDEACRWAVELGIMAHELAHHCYGDAFYPRSFAQEQRADRVVGQVLRAFGVDPQLAARVFAELAPVCSSTHGCASQRVAAIQIGYGFVNVGGGCSARPPGAPTRQ